MEFLENHVTNATISYLEIVIIGCAVFTGWFRSVYISHHSFERSRGQTSKPPGPAAVLDRFRLRCLCILGEKR